jgi:hypothetical protein
VAWKAIAKQNIGGAIYRTMQPGWRLVGSHTRVAAFSKSREQDRGKSEAANFNDVFERIYEDIGESVNPRGPPS